MADPSIPETGRRVLSDVASFGLSVACAAMSGYWVATLGINLIDYAKYGGLSVALWAAVASVPAAILCRMSALFAKGFKP